MIAIKGDKTHLTIQYIICLPTPTNFELMDYCVQKCILMLNCKSMAHTMMHQKQTFFAKE